MRLSMDQHDPAYDPMRGRRAAVFLDGERVRDCVTADEEAGEVVVFARDAFGRLIVDRDAGQIERETLKGEVKIVVGRLPH